MDSILSKALASYFDKQKGEIAPGNHEIDKTITLKIKGTVKKSASSMVSPTVEIPLISTMALLLQRMECQRENAAKIIRECMIEAMLLKNAKQAKPENSQMIAELIKDAEAAMDFVKTAILDRLPKVPKNGATMVNVVIEELNQPAEPAEPAAA